MRYRPAAGRLIIELFYGSDFLERDNGSVTIMISQMARRLHLRPVRLCETLEWMQRFGLILDLHIGRKTARCVLKEPTWRKRIVWADTEKKIDNQI